MTTPHSYTELGREVTRTVDHFLESLAGVPAEQWGYTPSPEVWSVGQAAEHTAGVFQSIQKLLGKKLLASPLPAGSTPAVKDEMILQVMMNRGKRYTAPDFALPTGKWGTREALEKDLLESRAALLTWLDTLTVDLRGYALPHPLIGLLDGVQWLLFAAAHTERHTHQIIDFRKSSGF